VPFVLIESFELKKYRHRQSSRIINGPTQNLKRIHMMEKIQRGAPRSRVFPTKSPGDFETRAKKGCVDQLPAC
jgi:hypothetical protein